jgi:hypothetical protein
MRFKLLSNTATVIAWLLCIATACAGQAPKVDAIHYWGRIIDRSTGKPIESARIRVIPSTYVGARRSDSRGRFSFWTGFRKSDQIEIEHDGYQTLCLLPQCGDLNDIRMQAQGLDQADLSSFGVTAQLILPSQSVAPAIVTADSGPKSSGAGNRWSAWYRLGVGAAPQGYTLQKVDFWLTGDDACGLSAQCRETKRSDREIRWEFRLQGHSEIGAPLRTEAVAHIRAVYRAIE